MSKTHPFHFLFFFLLYSLLATPAWTAVPTILVVGDSLSSGYGLDLPQGWVSLLEKRLATAGFPHQVANASIGGDTSRGGLARLPAILERHRPSIVILELGGNDGLRALSLQVLEENLSAMIELCRKAGAQVVLVGIRIPPNYGLRYTEKFQTIYGELAKRYDVPLVPFLLEGIATSPNLMQEDGIHPRAEAQPLILDNVWPILEPLLRQSVSFLFRHLPGNLRDSYTVLRA
jgi:acyl-CoA thioesterase-1